MFSLFSAFDVRRGHSFYSQNDDRGLRPRRGGCCGRNGENARGPRRDFGNDELVASCGQDRGNAAARQAFNRLRGEDVRPKDTNYSQPAIFLYSLGCYFKTNEAVNFSGQGALCAASSSKTAMSPGFISSIKTLTLGSWRKRKRPSSPELGIPASMDLKFGRAHASSLDFPKT